LNVFNSLSDAIAQTYNISNDDNAFRSNPSNFEQLRNEYKYRREFAAYDFKGGDNRIDEILKKLGFKASNQ